MATNILGLMDYVQQQGDKGRQQGQQQSFNRLAGQAYTAPAAQQGALVGQMVGIDPKAGVDMGNTLADRDKAQQTDHLTKLRGAAQFALDALKSRDPARIQGAGNAVGPYLTQLTGKQFPGLDESMLPALYQVLAQTGGEPDVKGVVVAPGSVLANPANGERLLSNPALQQYQNVPTGAGTVAGAFDRSTGTIRPAALGAAPGSAPSADPMQPLIEQANHAIQMGAPEEKVRAWLMQQAQQMGAQPQAPGQGAAQPSQFGVGAPKAGAGADAFRSATPDELKQYGLPDGAVAQVNTKTGKLDVISKPPTLSADKLADVAVKRQKVEQAKQESVATFNDSITKIDGLLNDPSFGSLGTFTGDIAAKIPHTDTANAKAALDTISAQSVINVLSSLKSLSDNGASGFGALSEKEGEILRNASANLSTSQDNAAIKRNLLDLRQKLARSRDRIAAQEIKLPEDSVGQQAAPATPSGDFSHLWGG